MAHHYKFKKKNTPLSWKANRNEGGGALRFYCIHLIHLFSIIPEWKKIECSNQNLSLEDTVCDLKLVNDNLTVKINCDTKNYNKKFKIVLNDELIIDSDDPFIETEVSQNNKDDRRVFYLKQVINKALENKWFSENELNRHISLWKKIEDVRQNRDC
jgi:hypothetical protein